LTNRRKSAELILTIAMIIIASFVAQGIVKNPITNVSAIMTSGIGAYWDQTCTQKITSIAWGTLSPGQVRSVVVYIRNEGVNITYLDITEANWIPANAGQYFSFKWDCAIAKLLPTKIVKITATLAVSPNIHGIGTFSFDVTFQALAAVPKWDVNRDGRVNLLDLIVVARVLGTTPTSQKWNSNADLNGDQEINVLDMIIVEDHLGLNYT
jgi:hypothetical protein